MKPNTEKTIEDTIDTKDTINENVTNNINTENNFSQIKNVGSIGFGVSQKKLQEAIIWSEILGKPMCKRRKRR